MAEKKKRGRPTVMTNETLRKLEDAFSIGASDREATFYAGIAMSTFYDYQTEHPEFVERKEALKEKPVMLARQTVVNGIAKDPKLAMDYLKAKKRDEFASRQEVTGKDGEAIQVETFTDLIREAVSHHADSDSDTTTR